MSTHPGRPTLASWLADGWSLVKSGLRFDRPKGPPWVLSSGSAGTPLVGAWTESRHEQVRHFKHWVFVAVDRIASSIAKTMPNVSVVRDTSDPSPATHHPERWLPPLARQKALVPLQLHEELEPVPCDHPLPALLQDANPHDTGFDLWYETVMFLLLTGNSYWWAPKNAAGRPTELWCIPSHWVWPVPDRDKVVAGYQVRPVEGHYTGVTLPAEDVVHFRRKSPVSKLDGYSPQTACAHWIDGAESIDKARSAMFKNGPMPPLKVEFTELNPDSELLGRIEARMAARYYGEHNAGRPMFVPKGAKVEPLWMTVREMDFQKSFDQIRDAILAAFGVPAVVAGINKNMTYGSVRAAQAGFAEFCVNPLLAFLGQAITERVAWQFDEKLRVWWPDQTVPDPTVREAEIKTDVIAGAISRNEIRALRGRKPVPGGDELLPGQYQPDGQTGNGQDGGPDGGDAEAPKKKPKKKKPKPSGD